MIAALVLAAAVYSGRDNQVHVEPPRVDTPAAIVTIDGVMDEAVWQQAVRLTDFSQYSPVDGRPADDPTEVLVFYSPTTIYFGIKAHAAPGSVHATLANRDRIDADDAIQIFLNPFKDGRQALVFGVNPLGIQADGALVEGTGNRGGAAFSALESGREVTDLTPDYVFQSKGRLTDEGYEIEIAIPFKTLRFPADRVQSWALNVVRRVQSSGHEDSWTPALRAKSSFLSQSGTLDGLTDLRRGLVLDLNPVVTAHSDGLPGGQRLELRHQQPRVRRQRPLGRHAEPDAERHHQSGLLAGRGRRQPVHVRSAQRAVLSGEAPVLSRRRRAVQRAEQPDLHAPDRRAGDRDQADRQERRHRHRAAVGGGRSGDLGERRRSSGVQHRAHPARPAARLEGRLRLHRPDRRRRLQSRVRRRRAPAVRIDLQPAAAGRRQPHRRGRQRHHRADLAGDLQPRRPPFRPALPDHRHPRGLSGRERIHQPRRRDHDQPDAPRHLVRRRRRARCRAGPPASWSTACGSTATRPTPSASRGSRRSCTSTTASSSAADGWPACRRCSSRSRSTSRSTATTRCRRRRRSVPQILPFTGVPYIHNDDYVVTLNTPQFSRFSGSLFYIWGHDENFYEWSPATIAFATYTLDWRPNDKLRISPQYQLQSYDRRSDGTHRRTRTDSAAEGGIPGVARDLRPRHRRVQRAATGRAARRLADQPADPDSRSGDRHLRAGARRSSATASASTRCSRISRRRARCSSPATAAS